MLPFLADKKKSIADVLVSERKPDEGKPSKNHGLLAASQDLIEALHSKDAQSVADALEAAFLLCDMQPHSEGPHLNEDEE